MNKILIIVRREFMTRVAKRSFILLTILMPFIFAALIFLPIWLSSVEGDEVGTVMLVDKTGRYGASLLGNPAYNFNPQPKTKMSFIQKKATLPRCSASTTNCTKTPLPSPCIRRKKYRPT
ncbi:MAG: ABC transporter permease, partial [Bacteroidaceae bacterium]|nr:ABC transporter permease [Bacteroidaceae bacterium]